MRTSKAKKPTPANAPKDTTDNTPKADKVRAAAAKNKDVPQQASDQTGGSEPTPDNVPFIETRRVAGGGHTDQAHDQRTAEQPQNRGPNAIQPNDPGLKWNDETGARGRVISVTKGGGDMGNSTFEEVLPANASDSEVALATDRLLERASR